MTETTEFNNLKASAMIMFHTLNSVFQLHSLTQLEPEDGDKAIDACEHCSEIAEAIVHYPCPTIGILLQDMVVDDVREDEAPAEEPAPEEEA